MAETLGKKLALLRELESKAEPTPWDVWDGPSYCGGGKDLCIGSGEKWLANMDEYWGPDGKARMEHDSTVHPNDREANCPICSFNDEVDARQKATADLI